MLREKLQALTDGPMCVLDHLQSAAAFLGKLAHGMREDEREFTAFGEFVAFDDGGRRGDNALD
jgi:hypothetical protein